MPPRSLRPRTLRELNPAFLEGRARRGGVLAAVRAAVAFLRAAVQIRGL